MNTDRQRMKSLYLRNFISGVPFDSEKDLGENLRDVHAVVPEEGGHNQCLCCRVPIDCNGIMEIIIFWLFLVNITEQEIFFIVPVQELRRRHRTETSGCELG